MSDVRHGAPVMGGPVLEVRGLTKAYGERTILDDVSLEVHAGRTIAIIGASGSGKSTILKCVGMLEPFQRGQVLLEGELLAEGGPGMAREPKGIARRRANFGFVFQQFNLFGHMTAIENVMEGLVTVRGLEVDDARTRAEQLLERDGVAHRKDAATPQMSGGEQQRVAIARALAMEPKCLLLDEPTSALDPELVAEVLDVVAHLASEGMTMVIVTHEMGFAYEVADEVAYLVEGRIHEQGPAREVLARPSTPELRSFLRRFHYSSLPPGGSVEASESSSAPVTPQP